MDRINLTPDMFAEHRKYLTGETVSIKSRQISFTQLRQTVMALHNQGEALKRNGLTFSHGNVGNEYIELAECIDELVSNGEPEQSFVIRNLDEVLAKEGRETEERKQLRKREELYLKDSRELDAIFVALGVDMEGGAFCHALVKIEDLFLAERDLKELKQSIASKKKSKKKSKR